MGFRMIRSLSAVEYNRKLFYCDTDKDLPPVTFNDQTIAIGSEALTLENSMHYVLNTEYKWIPVPWGVDGEGTAATFIDVPYGPGDPKPADYVRHVGADGVVQWKKVDIAGSAWINVETMSDLPAVGDPTRLYLVDKPGTVMKWDVSSKQYEKIMMSDFPNFVQQLSTDPKLAVPNLLYYFIDTNELVRYDEASSSFKVVATGGGGKDTDIIIIPVGDPWPSFGEPNQVLLDLATGTFYTWNDTASSWDLINMTNTDNFVVCDSSVLPTVGERNVLYYVSDLLSLQYYKDAAWHVIGGSGSGGECNLYCYTNKDSFPTIGQPLKLYYALDKNNVYYYHSDEKCYKRVNTACYLHNYVLKSDLPSVGEPGGVYYVSSINQYFLYAGGDDDGWLLQPYTWQIVSTLPQFSNKGTVYTLNQVGWLEITQDPTTAEWIIYPIQVRYFYDENLYIDTTLEAAGVLRTHPGSIDNNPVAPNFKPPVEPYYSLQQVLGVTSGQALSIVVTGAYNYVFIGKVGSNGVYVPFGGYSGGGSGDLTHNCIIQATRESFPVLGTIGTLYIASDEQRNYFWNGSTYVAINGSSSVWIGPLSGKTPRDTSLLYYFTDSKTLKYYDLIDATYKPFIGSYLDLTNKPSINGHELVGDTALSEIDVYSTSEVNNLIASCRMIKVVAEMPTPPTANTIYYVGTSMPYDVYLVDSGLNVISLGSSEVNLIDYQTKIDAGLETVSKSIVGAINELLLSSYSKDHPEDIVSLINSNPCVIYSTKSAFPTTGEANTLYIATDEAKSYFWNNITGLYVNLTADVITNYEDLLNKPKINSVELIGNRSLKELSILTETEIKDLIAAARSVKVVANKPEPTYITPSTLYYVGVTNPYHLWLADSDGVLHDMGEEVLDINLVYIGTLNSFPKTGDEKHIYIANDENVAYWWDGTTYKPLNSTGDSTTINIYNDTDEFPTPGLPGVIYIDKKTGRRFIWDGTRYIIYDGKVSEPPSCIVFGKYADFVRPGDPTKFYIATDDHYGYFWDQASNNFVKLNAFTQESGTTVRFDNSGQFPPIGTPGIIYYDKSTGKSYRWTDEEGTTWKRINNWVLLSAGSRLPESAAVDVIFALQDDLILQRVNIAQTEYIYMPQKVRHFTSYDRFEDIYLPTTSIYSIDNHPASPTLQIDYDTIAIALPRSYNKDAIKEFMKGGQTNYAWRTVLGKYEEVSA